MPYEKVTIDVASLKNHVNEHLMLAKRQTASRAEAFFVIFATAYAICLTEEKDGHGNAESLLKRHLADALSDPAFDAIRQSFNVVLPQ